MPMPAVQWSRLRDGDRRAGVAHDAMESVEGYEREDIDDETYAQAQGDLPEALCQLQSTMLEVVHK